MKESRATAFCVDGKILNDFRERIKEMNTQLKRIRILKRTKNKRIIKKQRKILSYN